ncbi:alpha-ketoglutarate-dependent dioxygenase AlkB family protein [Hanstruepera marina]|uniref:alpha-ketoglutarate-dependent dioxygenase AlkB family protein n=1 Tax=Hanstruepera marina TaxID=2873265 RepID=UPI001CA6EDC8|nr:alpha-ketoglutarate-dependent dioxygenase AlkB [Hanstruepera marina]
MDLFSTEKTILKLPQAHIVYIPNFLNTNEANVLFNFLKQQVDWQHDNITIFGKTYRQPRLTALYSNTQKTYTYSNITMNPKIFTPELLKLKKQVELASGYLFNSVLLNFYRDGNDSNGWHADNEKELGKNPVIASVSLGAERLFHFKHRTLKHEKYKLKLEHGSLLIMSGEMQKHWLHQIPKTKRTVGERINLTFRQII